MPFLKQTKMTLIISHWPRWVRTDVVRQHPRCTEMGIEGTSVDGSLRSVVGKNVQCVENVENVVETDSQDVAVARLKQLLDDVDTDVDMIIFRSGFDRDGTVHEDEDLYFRNLLVVTEEVTEEEVATDEVTEEETVPSVDVSDPRQDYFQTWRESSTLTSQQKILFARWKRHSGTESSISNLSVDEEPEWLKDHTPPPSSHPTVPQATRLVDEEQNTVASLVGILPPAQLQALLTRAPIPLATEDGRQLSLYRANRDVRIGNFNLDLSSWNANTQTYVVREAPLASSLAPSRDKRGAVAAMHRRRLLEFNRR